MCYTGKNLAEVHMERRDDSSLGVIWTFVAGIFVGIVGALLALTDEEGRIKKPVQSSVKKTKDILSGEEIRVKEWAQVAADQAQETFLKAKKQVADKVGLFRSRAGVVKPDRYAKAVSEVAAQLKAAGEVTVAQVKMLKEYLLDDYQQLTAMPEAKTVKKRVKKG
jgi:hypothetical protein